MEIEETPVVFTSDAEDAALRGALALKLHWDPRSFALPFQAMSAEAKAARVRSGLPGAGVEFKSVKTDVKADSAARRIELWVAAYGNVDDTGEVIPFGAAEKSVKREGGQGLIKFFWNHTLLLGQPEVVEEHKEGIFMVGKVDEDPSLDRYISHAKSGAAGHGSIGYSKLQVSKTMVDGVSALSLDEIKLYEGSLCIWPANRAATVEAVKSEKGLWEFAWAIQAQAQMLDALRTIARYTDEEWAHLSDEERQMAQELLDAMSDAEKSLRSGLKYGSDLEVRIEDPRPFEALQGLVTTYRKSLTN